MTEIMAGQIMKERKHQMTDNQSIFLNLINLVYMRGS